MNNNQYSLKEEVDKPILLTKEEVKQNLETLPGWEYKNNMICKEFRFKDFLGSFNFLNELVPYFESIGHHPDIHIHYNRIKFELQTHSSGNKITDLDIEVAQEIETRYDTRE